MSTVALPKSELSAALARKAYQDERIRMIGTSLEGADCLVASRQGLFAVGRHIGVTKIAHGWFFGIRSTPNAVYVFEACDRPHARSYRGRLVRFACDGRDLSDATILACGLDNQCHQLALFDDSIWLVDTANQAILQFDMDGTILGTRRPFPLTDQNGAAGAYLHLNGIAPVRGGFALMLHNGAVLPEQPSELAIFDRDWNLRSREPIAGRGCHDIVEDDDGVLWHCASIAGQVINSAGTCLQVSDRMTRGLAITKDRIVVGTSDFGRRHSRQVLTGGVLFIHRPTGERLEVAVPGAPTDLILL